MANVLPPKNKDAIARLFWGRVLIVTSLSLAVAAIVTIVALLPSYVIIRSQISSETASPQARSENTTLRAELVRSQQLLSQIADISSASSTLDVLKIILDARPPGVSIDQVNYSRVQKGDSKIVIAGTSRGRETVNAYRVALSEKGGFKNVSVPVSSLVGTEDGRFSMTISGNF